MKELRSPLSAFFRAAGESACAHGKPHFIAACRLYVVPRSRALRPISCTRCPIQMPAPPSKSVPRVTLLCKTRECGGTECVTQTLPPITVSCPTSTLALL